MGRTHPVLRLALAIATLVLLAGCPVFMMSSNSTTPGGEATGKLELTVKWPERQIQGFDTQSIPLSTNALVVWVREGETVLSQKTLLRDKAGDASLTLTVKVGNNLAVETKAYRESSPEPDKNRAIARGTATVNVKKGEATKTELTLDALFAPAITSLDNNVGKAGDTLTLSGSNFGTGNSSIEVSFNGGKVPLADLNRLSDTQITVKIPVEAKTGKLTVKADGIESVSNAVYWVLKSVALGTLPGKIVPKERFYPNILGSFEYAEGENFYKYAPGPLAGWITSDPSVVTVTALGVLKALKPGTVEVKATLGGLESAPKTLTVHQFSVSTLAGGGNGDGQGTNCIIKPYAMTEDSQGNIYVTENEHHRIRKIDCNGNVTLFAGNGTAGYADGMGTSAQFSDPRGIAVDDAGNLYVADYGNFRIRKITPSGTVTSLAGDGSEGSTTGTGTGAQLLGPQELVRETAYSFIFTDGCMIRKVYTDGRVTNIAGSPLPGNTDGPRASARFNYPQGLAFASSGVLYIVDTRNRALKRINLSGEVETVQTDDGMDVIGQPNMEYANGIAIDAQGNIYISDPSNHCLWKRPASGGVLKRMTDFEEGYQEGSLQQAQLYAPHGLLARSDGSILVADTQNYRIRKITGTTIAALYGGGSPDLQDGPVGNSRFYKPQELAFDPQGNLVVLDSGNFLIRKISTSGMVSTITGGYYSDITPATGSLFKKPGGLTLDSQGNIYLTDLHSVKKIDGEGNVSLLTSWSCGYDDGQVDTATFFNPHGLANDEYGNLYVADYQNCVVRKITSEGFVSTLAGKHWKEWEEDGIGDAAGFRRPKDIVYTPTKLYLTDYLGKSIRKINALAMVTTIQPSFEESSMGFSELAGITVDDEENLYVLDRNIIWKVNPWGFATLLAGRNSSGAVNGPASAATFNLPEGIAIGKDGNLYIGDTGNNLIRKITLQ